MWKQIVSSFNVRKCRGDPRTENIEDWVRQTAKKHYNEFNAVFHNDMSCPETRIQNECKDIIVSNVPCPSTNGSLKIWYRIVVVFMQFLLFIQIHFIVMAGLLDWKTFVPFLHYHGFMQFLCDIIDDFRFISIIHMIMILFRDL